MSSSEGEEMVEQQRSSSHEEVVTEDGSKSEMEKESMKSKDQKQAEEDVPGADDDKKKQKKNSKKKKKNHRKGLIRRLTRESNHTLGGLTPEMMKKAQEKEVYPIQLRFENLCYFVPNTKKVQKKTGHTETQILHDISGTFQPGTITAIMGSSGAGKTTLLNVLANRTEGRVTGEILYNGNLREEARTILKHQAYVMQDDIILKTQTPQEVLQFSARMRIPNTYTDQQKNQRVDSIIKELNISNCKDTIVGAPGLKRGISGGERKRVSIGMELVTNPSLLFLDEPTSGLDSFTAEIVIETLKNLAASGRTIVCTIHQPNTDIFHKFDHLILLAKGHMVYNGPTKKAVNYFSEIGYECPPYSNPADFYMKLIHIEQGSKETEERVGSLIENYNDSEAKKIQSEVPMNEVPIVRETKEKHHGYAQSTFMQLFLLLLRNFKDIVREPLKVRATLIQTLFLGLLVGLIYLQVDNDQGSVQSRTGALFFILVNQSMSSVVQLVNTFPEEKIVFLREHSNNMYRTTAYYLAKIFGDLPFQMVFPAIFGTLTYWMIGFRSDAGAYFMFLLILVVTANVGSSLGLLIGIIAPNSGVAIALVPMTIIPFMIFSGFFLNSDNVPVYFIWVEYISFIRYAFEGVALNEFTSDVIFTCSEDQKLGVPPRCPIRNGDDVVNNLGFEDGSTTLNLIILLIMLVAFRSLAYVILLLKARQKSTA